MDDVSVTAEAVARASYGRLIAFMAARTGDVAGAEDALSEAFATALAVWPSDGVPANPAAWLLTVARRKLIDAARRHRTGQDAASHWRLIADERAAAEQGDVPDERLTLMFVCAHPAIDPGVRAPLMLQTVLGLNAATIASAFLTAPAAMGQRLVRAKSRIKLAGIPFRLPAHADLPERLGAVLEAIYAAFSTGWMDPAGAEPRERDLAREAIWLCRVVVALLPAEPEALGLLALMLYAESRRAARRTPAGDYVPLDQQDVRTWYPAPIREAEALLRRAGGMAMPGRFQLEAAVQSAHVAGRAAGSTDWRAISHLYAALFALTGSPVVAINQAVAMAETNGPTDGLEALDALADDPRMANYQPYWAARAGLQAGLGLTEEAEHAYRRAIGLEADPAVRRFLQQRQAALTPPRDSAR